MQQMGTYASMLFIVNGFISVNESKAETGSESSIVFSCAGVPLSKGLMFSWSAGVFRLAGLPESTLERSGTRVVWTGVIPPNPPRLPPQKFRPARRGDVGRSLWRLGVSRGLLGAGRGLLSVSDANTAAETAGRGAGGGSTGVSMLPRPSSNNFLSADIS